VYLPRVEPKVPTVEKIGPPPAGTSARLTISSGSFRRSQRPAAHLPPRGLGRSSDAKGLGWPEEWHGIAVKPGKQFAQRATEGETSGWVRSIEASVGKMTTARVYKDLEPIPPTPSPEDLEDDEMILNMGPQHPRPTGCSESSSRPTADREGRTAAHRVPPPNFEKHARTSTTGRHPFTVGWTTWARWPTASPTP
jgi:hypothetical protein